MLFAVLTTNAPLRGLARLTLTLAPLACFATYAPIASARFLNACQDLHASTYTALGGTTAISGDDHGVGRAPPALATLTALPPCDAFLIAAVPFLSAGAALRLAADAAAPPEGFLRVAGIVVLARGKWGIPRFVAASHVARAMTTT